LARPAKSFSDSGDSGDVATSVEKGRWPHPLKGIVGRSRKSSSIAGAGASAAGGIRTLLAATGVCVVGSVRSATGPGSMTLRS
jgi:hypothetical protein